MLAFTLNEQLEEGAMKVKQWVASLAAAGVLAGGGVTAAALVAPSAGAQDSIPGVEAQAGTSSPGDAHHPVRQALDGLVADGTITQDQENKVYDALVAQAKADREARQQQRQQWEQAVASAVGTTPDQLKSDLQAGQTLAEIGQANGKSRQDVIDGIAAAAKARLDQAVANGTITQDQANKVLQRVTDRLGTVVDQAHPRVRAGLNRLRHRARATDGGGSGVSPR